MRRKRDSQRAKVYKAEWLAMSVFDQEVLRPLSIQECQKMADRVSRSMGWKERPIIVVSANNRRSACATRDWRKGRIIKLPTWARTKVVVCHELAHHVAGLGTGHNGRFVSKFIQLVRRFVGPVEAEVLRMAMKQCKAKVRGSDNV